MLVLFSGNGTSTSPHQREGQTNSPVPLFRHLFSTHTLWFCHNILLGAHVTLPAHDIPDDPSSLSFSALLCVTSHLAELKCISVSSYALVPFTLFS